MTTHAAQLRDERGAVVSVWTAVIATTMVLVLGIAVDLSGLVHAKQQAGDAAGAHQADQGEHHQGAVRHKSITDLQPQAEHSKPANNSQDCRQIRFPGRAVLQSIQFFHNDYLMNYYCLFLSSSAILLNLSLNAI